MVLIGRRVVRGAPENRKAFHRGKGVVPNFVYDFSRVDRKRHNGRFDLETFSRRFPTLAYDRLPEIWIRLRTVRTQKPNSRISRHSADHLYDRAAGFEFAASDLRRKSRSADERTVLPEVGGRVPLAWVDVEEHTCVGGENNKTIIFTVLILYCTVRAKQYAINVRRGIRAVRE